MSSASTPTIRVRRRNWSSRAKRFERASGVVVSIPKSGRTWLNVFFNHYVTSLHDTPLTLSTQELQSAGLPNLEFTHDLWQHVTGEGVMSRLRGKSLLPARMARDKKIILLTRDPRDIVVSNFFQLTRRKQRRRKQFQDLALSAMVRDPAYGIRCVVAVMNTWLETWNGRDNCTLVRYEDCRSNPGTFREILEFLGVEVSGTVLARSLEFSCFENMKALEKEGRFGGILRARDPKDPDSFKVRRGVVGGYSDYLDKDDIAYMNEALQDLDRRLGYTPRAGSRSVVAPDPTLRSDSNPAGPLSKSVC